MQRKPRKLPPPALVGPQPPFTPVFYTKGSENYHGSENCINLKRVQRTLGPRHSRLHAASLSGRTPCPFCCLNVTCILIQSEGVPIP